MLQDGAGSNGLCSVGQKWAYQNEKSKTYNLPEISYDWRTGSHFVSLHSSSNNGIRLSESRWMYICAIICPVTVSRLQTVVRPTASKEPFSRNSVHDPAIIRKGQIALAQEGFEKIAEKSMETRSGYAQTHPVDIERY